MFLPRIFPRFSPKFPMRLGMQRWVPNCMMFRLDDTTCCNWNFNFLIKSEQRLLMFDVMSYQWQPKISLEVLRFVTLSSARTKYILRDFRHPPLWKMRCAFFWDFTQRRLVVCYRRFGDNLSFLSSMAKQSKKSVWPSKMRPISYSETSVINYHLLFVTSKKNSKRE